MSEDQALPPEPTAEHPVVGPAGPPVPPGPPEPPRPRWRDRAWSLRAVIAVALASVILGGLAGAALASVGDHQDERRGPGFGRGFGPGMPPGRRGFGQGPDRHFNDPYGQGQRQWGQGQPPNGPNGPVTPNGTPTPPKATPTG